MTPGSDLPLHPAPAPAPALPKDSQSKEMGLGAHAQTHTGNSLGCQRRGQSKGEAPRHRQTMGVWSGPRDGPLQIRGRVWKIGGQEGVGGKAGERARNMLQEGRTMHSLSSLLLSSEQASQRPPCTECLTMIQRHRKHSPHQVP